MPFLLFCYVIFSNEAVELPGYTLIYFIDFSQNMDTMCEFRAGKMSLEGTRVVPDTRKGLVRIARVCTPEFCLD
jgi:hypothetical protein